MRSKRPGSQFLYGICTESLLQAVDSIRTNRGCTVFACFLRITDFLGIAGQDWGHAAGDARDWESDVVHVSGPFLSYLDCAPEWGNYLQALNA